MQRFDFHSASSVEDALDYMAHAEGECKIVAGGTDLIPFLRSEELRPAHVLDVMGIADLRGVREMDGKIRIGPCTTFTEITESQVLNRSLQLLCLAAGAVGGPQIRNRGTIGGNIITASPCADVLPAVTALGGIAELQSARSGKREVAVAELVDGAYLSRIRRDEILTGIVIDKPMPGTRFGYMKLARRKALATSRMSLSIVLVMGDGGTVADISIVPGSVMPVARRMIEAEEILKGRAPDERLLEEAARALSAGVLKTTGTRSSSEYKLPVIRNVFKRLLRGLLIQNM
jgi:CO/xanthine dehydrogenase FAD-binding subunit